MRTPVYEQINVVYHQRYDTTIQPTGMGHTNLLPTNKEYKERTHMMFMMESSEPDHINFPDPQITQRLATRRNVSLKRTFSAFRRRPPGDFDGSGILIS